MRWEFLGSARSLPTAQLPWTPLPVGAGRSPILGSRGRPRTPRQLCTDDTDSAYPSRTLTVTNPPGRTRAGPPSAPNPPALGGRRPRFPQQDMAGVRPATEAGGDPAPGVSGLRVWSPSPSVEQGDLTPAAQPGGPAGGPLKPRFADVRAARDAGLLSSCRGADVTPGPCRSSARDATEALAKLRPRTKLDPAAPQDATPDSGGSHTEPARCARSEHEAVVRCCAAQEVGVCAEPPSREQP